MRAIIFGANGQDGFYLEQLLKSKAINVIGVSRGGNFLRVDIADFEAVSAFVKKERPDYIFHFAANSTTRHETLFENHASISTGTWNILEAVRTNSPDTKVFISGSALQFKNDNRPIKETDIFEARDPYSVSRIQSVYAARYYRRLGIKAYVGYLFNHDSPLRTERHMCKKIAEAAKRIGAGSNEKLLIGDTAVIKEWTFAGDTVKAVLTLIQQDEIFEANIGSGKGYSIEDWLQQCFSIAGKDWHDHVIEDETFKSEFGKLLSDPSLIFSLGWRPETTFNELAQMMMM